MEQLSKLFLQVYIDKIEFKTTLENIIQNRFVNQKPIQVNGFDLEITAFEDFNLHIKDSILSYNFTIKLNLKSSKLSGVGGLAKVKLNLDTNFNISEDWKLTTKTYLKEHEWIEKPVMKLKILSIPSTGILELLIGAFDDKMCSEIDKLVQKGSDLKKFIDPVLESLKNPLEIERISNFNFNIKPNNLKIHMDEYSDKFIRVKIFSGSELVVKVKELNSSNIFQDLPSISYEDFDVLGSRFLIDAEINHAELSEILINELKEFNIKGKKVNFEKIRIETADEKLHLEVELSGDIKGTVFLNFEPVFNEEEQFVKLEDLKFKLESKQLFVRTTSWLFKKEIERQLAKYAKIDLRQILNNIKFSTNKTLEDKELYPGLNLTADIDAIVVKALRLLPEGLALNLDIAADFSAQVRVQKSLTQS